MNRHGAGAPAGPDAGAAAGTAAALTVADLRARCSALAGSREDFPFGPDTLVMKVQPEGGEGRVYALIALDSEPLRLSLKCDPVRAEALRREYAAIVPGYHLNKRHWNTLTLDDSLSAALAGELLAHSHTLVLASLTRAQRAGLGL